MIIRKVGIGGWKSLKSTIEYLVGNKSGDRVLEVGYRNIGIENPNLVCEQMRAYYIKNRYYWGRGEDKTYGHYVLSFDKKRESLEKSRTILDEFRSMIGYEKCQCFYVVHGNTENQHIHTIINRWDVETEKFIGLNQIKMEVCKLQEIAAYLSDKYQIGTDIPRIYKKDENGQYKSIYRTGKNIRQYKEEEKQRLKREVNKIEDILLCAESLEDLERELDRHGWKYYSSEDERFYLVNESKRMWIKDEEMQEDLQYDKVIKRLLGQELDGKGLTRLKKGSTIEIE